MFQVKVVEEIKTHILLRVTFFSENRAGYEIMWKNTVGWGRPQMTIWRMHIACCITQATHTLTVCNTYCFSTTVVARKRLNVSLYVHCLSCCWDRCSCREYGSFQCCLENARVGSFCTAVEPQNVSYCC